MRGNGLPLLLLIDLQNAFCDDDGSMARQGRPIEAMREAARQCARLAGVARAAGAPVAWTRMMFRPDYSDGGMVIRLRPGLRTIGALRAGTPDVELCSLARAAPGEPVFDKPRYSALLHTGLEEWLRETRVGRVVVAGVTTSMCVETTVRDLAQRDQEVAVIADACGDFDVERHRASLSVMGFGFARVLTMRNAPALFAGADFDDPG
jgi:nicotinamidase-related amidase